ncbi:uncharacterized protein LOC133165904 [Syngnathus typhle]|uniref:uncharacterized protein LOC133165904 n=1 Tax=Syngnathus typhle TaxID=161592 RepID=UPI002A6A2660|nr:uncharacterized protein LOC133165904 [Syngnathus typhle]
MADLVSNEVGHLDEESKKRYREKLNLVGTTDPYLLQRSMLKSPEHFATADLPDLSYPDIYNYLVDSPSPYTGKDLKAYKSLDAYKYFTAGFMHDGLIWQIPNKNRFLLMTKVKHSQRMNDPPLRPWVAIAKDGQILCCHCTCMAGLGETCSHSAASLFALETLIRMKTATSCTSLPCDSPVKLLKYADDTTLIGLIQDGDETAYR